MQPSGSTSTWSATGEAGRPGIVIIVPQRATIRPAPVYGRSSRTGTGKPEPPDGRRRRVDALRDGAADRLAEGRGALEHLIRVRLAAGGPEVGCPVLRDPHRLAPLPALC